MKKYEPWLTGAAVALLCALSAWRRFRFLDSSPYPMGIDGYFYADQLRSILEHGHLNWPAPPLAFWLMAPFAALTDPIVGAKLGAAILGALGGVPAFLLGKRLGGSRAAGLAACAILTASAGSFYLSVEFVKQGVGVTIALAALCVIAKTLERPSRAWIAASAACVLATWLTHKSAAGMVVVVALPAIAIELRARELLVRAANAAGGAHALVVIAGLVFPDRFLALGDLRLVAGLFGERARWELPAIDFGDHALWIGHEALCGAIAVAALAAVTIVTPRPQAIVIRPSSRERAFTYAFAALAIVIAIPWLDVVDPQGLGFRLRLIAFVPFALVAAAALGAIAELIPMREARWLPALAALGWLAVQPPARDEGVVRAHPALVAAVRALDGTVPSGDMIVTTERHIQFMTVYYTRIPTALDPALVPRAHRWRLMPLAFIGSGSPLDHALLDARRALDVPPPRGVHPRNPNGLVLVAEPTWEWVLDHLPPKTRAWAKAWHTI
ncbi:MAG TPA: glycosyltransferase family 39 protein [Kofleriaceae bacterium]|nr:glycosyltransferase family 39 protein [Kofleriaceae bacterium]